MASLQSCPQLIVKNLSLSYQLASHLVVVGVALGGDMAMYSEEPSAEGAAGFALDTSEEY